MKLPGWAETIRIRLNPPVHEEEIETQRALARYHAAAVEEKNTADKARAVIEQLLEQMDTRNDRSV